MAGRWRVRRGRRSDSSHFLNLVSRLAEFEHLGPPNPSAKRRIVADIFDRKRLNLFVAESRKRIVGYALYFYTYSSFLALPTLYIEDLFVAEEERRSGIGRALFLKCASEAARRGCGRMEWSVLTWNTNAIRFYGKLGARRLDQWVVFRLDAKPLKKLAT